MFRTLFLVPLGWFYFHPVVGAETPTFDDSALQGTLVASLPYEVNRVFSEQIFRNPVDFIPEPGTNRIFIIQVNGDVYAFDPTDPSAERQRVSSLSDHEERFGQLYGMAFHPQYETNGIVYLAYKVQGLLDPEGTRVIECQMDHVTNHINLSDSRLIITWPQGGHNGASLQFGPDGYLYISAGDADNPNPPDKRKVGQDCSNLLSTVMRIDVDRRDPGLAYAIPPDNPFNDLAGARPEIWAFGFRNPWRMSFDKKSGDLWVGDVGWDMWELVYRVQRGANYGWSIMEGRQPINVTWDRGPVPISPPIAEHPHTEARSITGGYVYHGERFPDLRGAYIYGDYETGKIWALWQDQGTRNRLEEIADCELRIICFGQTWDGEVYIVDYAGGIYELNPRGQEAAAKDSDTGFPEKLSETGLFTNTATQAPAKGLISYDIKHPRWADGLVSKRWIALPQGGQVSRRGNINIARSAFPEGTLFIKTLSTPATDRPIETQVLQRRQSAWRAFSYAWNDRGDDASLVPQQGQQRIITLGTGDSARAQPWHAAGASDCRICHNDQAGSVLGFNEWQLTSGTITEFQEIGVLHEERRRRNQATEQSDPHLARIYLDVNCASCHRMNGGGLVPMNLEHELPNDRIAALGEKPQRGIFSIPGAQVIAPGQPERSTLYYRMAKLGSGRMPHLGSKVVDSEGLSLIYEWIESLDPDADRTLADDDEVPRAMVRLHEQDDPLGMVALDQAVGDLLLRFDDHDAPTASTSSPESKGDPTAILALESDPARGAELLLGTRGAICLTCHQVGSQGRDFGPAFDGIGSRRTKEHLLESLLLPSAEIEAPYVHYTVTTNSKTESLSGFIRHHDRSGILLRDAALQEITFPIADIATMTASDISVMPPGLGQAFSDNEIADLLAYLESLR